MSTLANIASFLPQLARERPHALAIVQPQGRNRDGRVLYAHHTCAQLDEESDAIAKGLELLGITRGTRTVLMVQPSLDFFALFRRQSYIGEAVTRNF